MLVHESRPPATVFCDHAGAAEKTEGGAFIVSAFVNAIQVAELKAISVHSSRNIDGGGLYGLGANVIQLTKLKHFSPYSC